MAGRKKPETKDEAGDRAAAERFVRDVVTRGEAARPDEHGDLPPGATHEIVGKKEGGLPRLRRKRFSMT